MTLINQFALRKKFNKNRAILFIKNNTEKKDNHIIFEQEGYGCVILWK